MTQHDFGKPIVDEVAPSVDASSNGTPAGDEVQEYIDINDPRLTSEILEANLEADAYAFPPPPPDGRYRAKLKLIQQENSNKEKMDYIAAIWGKDKKMVCVAQVEASIIDPSGKPNYDGVKVYDRNVSTFIRQDGGSKVTTIIARLRQPNGEPWVKPGDKMTSGDFMKILVKALAGEPEIGLETIWEWNCQKCGEEAKAKKESYPRATTGMHNFPVVNGKRSAEMICQAGKGHGPSRARATIARFLHLSELK